MTQPAGNSSVQGIAMLLATGADVARGTAARSAWTVAPPASPAESYSLNAVAALSATAAWAVGQTRLHPLIERWDGTNWEIVPSPRSASAVGPALVGVAAVAPDTAIAVGGAYDRLIGSEVPLVQHWDGTQWTERTLGAGYVLTGVAMFSVSPGAAGGTGHEAWAVGHGLTGDDAVAGPVALHWDGTVWHRVPLPGPGRQVTGRRHRWRGGGTGSARPDSRLLAVAGSSARDVWAVGTAGAANGGGPLVLHYDGSQWREMRAPRTGRPLTTVVALGPDDVWAAGSSGVFHWDGRHWAAAGGGPAAANTLTALSAREVWAAGGRAELTCFDGKSWRSVAAPPPLDSSAVWLGSAAIAPGTVWMVGSRQNGSLEGRRSGSLEGRRSGASRVTNELSIADPQGPAVNRPA